MRTQFSSAASRIALVTLFTLLVVAYWIALPGPFLLDDYSNLPQARPDAWSLSALIDASLSNASGPLGRPVSAFTFSLNYLITGDNTLGFKVANLAIHIANTCLVFLLIHILATQVTTFHPVAELEPYHLALAVAFFWALHPIHMSTVMYVVQRMSLLSTFFILASMNCYVSARIICDKNNKIFWGLAVASLTLGLLAVFSKENGVLLIAYLVVVEWSVLRHLGNWTNLDRKKGGIVLVVAGVLALICVYPIVSLLKGLLGGYEFRNFSLNERLFTQPAVVVDYLGQTLFPRIGQMGLYFDDIQIIQELDTSVVWPSLIIIFLATAFFALTKRAPLISLGIGLFLASHLVESTFLPLELKFEHRNYFGSIGIVLAVVSVLGTTRFVLNRRFISYSLFVLLTAVLASQTYMRSQIWKDELTFNNHEVRRAPDSKRARSALAISLSRAGRTNDALAQVQTIITRYPDDTYAPVQLFQICALASSNCQNELREAFHALENGRIRIDTVSILGDLAANNRAGLIEGLSKKDLANLILLAANSQHLHLPSIIEASLQHLLSEAFLEAGEHRKATKAIQKSTTLAPANLTLLTRAAEIIVGVGSIEDAEIMLNRLTMASTNSILLSGRTLAVKRHLEKRRKLEN